MNRKYWMILGCAAALAFGGCDDDPEPTDGGNRDTGGGGEDAQVSLPVAGIGDDLDALTAPDLDCRGTRTAPTGGAESTFPVVAGDFLAGGTQVYDLTVQLFLDNVIADTCVAPNCIEVGTGATPETATGMTGGWLAYRVVAGTGEIQATPTPMEQAYVESIETNQEIPASGTPFGATAVSRSSITTFTGLLNIDAVPGTAIVTGTASDCNGDEIANTTVRVFDGANEIAYGMEAVDTQAFYFDTSSGTSLPTNITNRSRSNTDGLFGVGNIRLPSSGSVRVEIWGTLTEGGSPELIGCESTPIAEDGISIVNVGPERSDGPSDCSGG